MNQNPTCTREVVVKLENGLPIAFSFFNIPGNVTYSDPNVDSVQFVRDTPANRRNVIVQPGGVTPTLFRLDTQDGGIFADRGRYKIVVPGDPANSRLLARIPPQYVCVSHPNAVGSTSTAYAAVFGAQCVFRGTEPVKIVDITDGASNTLLVVEAGDAGIPWMKPEDVDVTKHPALGDQSGFSSRHTGEVVNVMSYGAFVELEPGIEGLVPVSEMTYERRSTA